MSTLIEKLTAEGGGESVGFLNSIVAQLWPYINVAGSKMAKDIADPMFKSMLPGPLSTLQFTKVDLGAVPFQFSNVNVTKTETDGINLDLNLDWAGKSDIELDGEMIPKVGVKGVAIHGRLSILLCPLTNVMPLIGAAQVAFVNPPILKLDFTGAASIADFEVIDGAICGVILSIINSMLVLPNRLLIKLDASNDFFKTYLYPLGILRITVEKAWGFAEEKKSASQKFLSKLTRASPDAYCKVSVGAEAAWRTTTKNNTTSPSWNEVHDFVVADFDQCITVDLLDQDIGRDTHIGLAVTTVKDVLLAGGKQELSLVHKEQPTEGRILLSCVFYQLAADDGSFSASDHRAEGRLCGVATVIVAGAFGIPGQREELHPSVVVTWGEKHHFQTATKSDAPGTDISNPTFDQAFRIPVTADMVGSGAQGFRIALMNKKQEIGAVNVPLSDVLKAPGMIFQNKLDVGGGATVRASICLSGISPAATMEEAKLAQRQK